MRFLDACDERELWHEPREILRDVSGVILGGSGEFDFDGGRAADDPSRTMSQTFLARLTPLLDYVFDHDIPTFGICYGHQLIGAYAGVSIWNDPKQKKTGTFAVCPCAETVHDPVFGSLTEPILTQYGHKDSLASVPSSAVLLMEGEQCQVAALRYQQHIYTTQFHPELTAADMIERLQNAVGYLPEGVAAEEIIKDDERSNALLRSFVDKVITPSVS